MRCFPIGYLCQRISCVVFVVAFACSVPVSRADVLVRFGRSALFLVGCGFSSALVFPLSVVEQYNRDLAMTELCHINIKCRLGRYILFSDKILQKVFCLCYNPSEQIWQPAFALNGLAYFFVYLGLFDL